jgi:para-aminobenzoate synthetase
MVHKNSNIPLQNASEFVIKLITSKLANQPPPLLVALDGPSGTGKSTLAAKIAVGIECAVIPLDDFFAAHIPDHYWDEFTHKEKLDKIFDWERLRTHALEPLLAGEPARWHAFDFVSGLRADGTYGMLGEPVVLQPAEIILLEGAYSTAPAIFDLIDLSVFVDAPLDVRHARTAEREDPEFLAKWRARWETFEEYYFTQVRRPEAFDLVIAGV